jgi:acetyl-CoA carboxylase biotin carboxylase subunit
MFTTFRKVLVANRGEIAIRILRACSELGMSTVAVYSEADRTALHVRFADEAYPIGPAPARESYLRIDKLIGVARLAGADAIHPGYGFLAENPDFAEACADAGIVFIGPSAKSIRLMGDKLGARLTARSLGLPVVPGSDREVADDAEAAKVAEEIGYPVLIKAVAGGGGKGMRVVAAPGELPAAYRAARGEARAAFGDDRVYVEKRLERVRHVEVQILADRHGNVIHLGERECSIQRRHQKLIEEAPATSGSRDLRHAMGEAAVRLARETGYETVGTVEFLLDSAKHFYFLEMNTRLQVEHPVTEMITGVDIVTEQIRAASGRRLRLRQSDVRLKGWALECRIAAEDPYNDFLPSIGRVTAVDEPSGPGVRVDSSVYEGSEVSLYYDPLIAKLIVYGETRGQTIQRMRRALSEFKILGIKTNIPFHLRMMESPSFIAGRVDTTFLDRASVLEASATSDRAKIAAIAAAAVAYRQNQAAVARMVGQKSTEASPWRLLGRRGAVR